MCGGRDELLISGIILRAFHTEHGSSEGLHYLLNTLITRKQYQFTRKDKKNRVSL